MSTCWSLLAYSASLMTHSMARSVSSIRSPCGPEKNTSAPEPPPQCLPKLTLAWGPSDGRRTTTNPSVRELTTILWISSKVNCSLSLKLLDSSR